MRIRRSLFWTSLRQVSKRSTSTRYHPQQKRRTQTCFVRPPTDKALAHVPRSKIRDQLLEVGFDDERQAEVVGGLSGGWKMKLELARAMLYNADLLLLDEV